MNAEQRQRQIVAIHIRFKQELEAGHLNFSDAHEWATDVCGRLVPSLKVCSDFELNMLRDRLEGKTPKMLDKLQRIAAAAGVRNLQAWMDACARNDSMAWLRGQTPESLPVSKLWRLCKMLESRAHRAHPRPARHVQRVVTFPAQSEPRALASGPLPDGRGSESPMFF